MSKLKHLKKEQQQIEKLFNEAFTENKPIAFPNRNGTSAYANLFYWAHLVAHETAEFPLHPHEGFEIMTFVLKGSVEHYDTASKVYTPLNAGDVQAIQAGSGVSHSERITKGTELFQIWFDPDFAKTMSQAATYKDYPNASFNLKTRDGVKELSYVGEYGPINSITKGLEIKKLSFSATTLTEELDTKATYSFYLLEGTMSINGDVLDKDDFYLINDVDSVTYEVSEHAELFVIKSHTTVNYRRFIERYQ